MISRPKPPRPDVLPGRYVISTSDDVWRNWASGFSLLKQLTRRHLVDRYRASYFGFLWSFFLPIFMMLIYSFVFRFIFRAAVPDVPFMAHFITAFLAWNFFSVAVANSAASVVGNAYLINKASFPRFLLPLSAVLSNMINYLVTLPILLVFLLILGVQPGWSLLLLPLALLLLLALAGGVGFLVASLAPFYRDLLHLLDIILMAWFFATPIVYHIDYVRSRIVEQGLSERLIYLYQLNPMVGAVRFIQATFFNQAPPWPSVLASCAWAFVLLGAGILVYERCAPHFSEA